MTGIVIIGAGQAGASLAARLRTLGYGGPLTLIGDEPAPPYQRPPLSKAYLLGEMDLDRLYLRAPSFWEEHEITLRLGTPVSAIDTAGHTIRLGDEVIGYDQLVLATGSVPRRLPAAIGGGLEGVHTVRTLCDADRMAPDFRAGRRLVIIGGGYIGLEAASVGAKLGLDVTVLEAAPRILQRVASEQTAEYFRSLHRAHGVSILEGTALARLSGADRVTGAVLADGTELPADFIICGIGILPSTALAEAAGIATENGIRTDAAGRTSAPDVWAAGDCASFPHGAGRLRLESVGHAIDHAELVAGNMLGGNDPYVARPWFWSDQYDVKLQIAGLNTGYDRTVIRDGGAGIRSIWYYRGGELLALDAMNDARAYMIGKRLIEAGRSPDPAVIADPGVDLKPLLKA
ncbi:MAG: FAD-dependent oxidoreductase [Defluviimonas sp.]|uniref:NAD(P)/FAD-dependent oxidoreductase n=1 Tax=Albidovulum sp. TaxID=1872424 RepID=UPI001DCAAF3A|nr:FAD-dependent oxidoreductase [Paracoccaceae bacterium]MCC0063238.1 FAD-dependent oxidoreductase [Defluviimonas sp.]